MSAPYWGKLPGPKPATAQTKSNRLSDDYVSASGEKDEQQPRRRSNRISVQTTNTEAPTESTLSPFASPTASSFAGQGLAPRPPSFPYSSPDIYPPDIADKRAHRQTRLQEQFDDIDEDAPPLPAAPEVPKAPPVSYRHPYGNGNGNSNGGGPPYPYGASSRSRPPRQSGPPGGAAAMEPEDEYYTRSPRDDPRDTRDYPVLDRDQKTFDAGPKTRRPQGELPVQHVRKGSVKEINTGRSFPLDTTNQARKSSVASQSDRRRQFADDRSPLQRLELTLDSITKEEKRARVEAAEARAREKTSRGGGKRAGPPSQQPQQVRFSDRNVSSGGGDQPSPRQAEPPSPIAAHRGPLSQNPPEEGREYGPGHRRSVSAAAAVAAPLAAPAAARQSGGGNMGIPQRNLSFRERAARNDIKPPNGIEKNNASAAPQPPPGPAPAATSPLGPSSGFSLTRSGSNKLKKDPPGDPWYRLRMEAQRDMPGAQAAPAAQVQVPRGAPVAVGGRTVDNSLRNKELPPVPATDGRRKSVGTRATFADTAGEDIGGIRRHATEPAVGGFEAARKKVRQPDSDDESESSNSQHGHHLSKFLNRPGDFRPGEGLYKPPQFLDEWMKATVGTLSGSLLNLTEDETTTAAEKDKAWWEANGRRRSLSSRPRKAEAFDGEYDESNAPTRFKPPLHLECGPLLRYCGIRREHVPSRAAKGGAIADREVWRGSVMIVTRDSDSSYDIAPTLRLFVQPIELLPPPPAEVNGELPPEYVDPIAGHPKLGRRGETLYVRPVEHLEEAKDLSQDETDNGLFEKTRSPPDVLPADGSTDLPGSFASRRKRIEIDGEKVSKYKDVRGFRLHQERGCTFWRFNMEVELGERQQRIAYRINRGPAMGFWVPARRTSMNVMFHSCNGFSVGVRTDDFSGPDPMWRDVLNTHQTQPFHVMVGGGDQIYNDAVMYECKLFQTWSDIRNPLHKHSHPFTPELQDELERFYLGRYCMWFSQGLFGLANSQIPMVNMFDDHDLVDGYGSYPHHDMNSPVFRGLGAVAFKYYMLFQHQSVMDETESSEPSWILGSRPGPYIGELSRSLYVDLGADLALLAVDCRTERTEYDVTTEETWKKIMNRCYKDVKSGHLLVLLGVPIAYPRLVWLENILTSRLMNPVKALGKTGMLGGLLNHIDGGVEVLDDLNDHWTAKNHKVERRNVVEQLQDLAMITSVRVTILSGDVHLAAVSQFYSHPRLGLPKHKDPRYMPNVISSAIANAPPPNLMADVLNKRNKVHHFDKDTEEDMIPMFLNGVEGKPRNNKHLLPHRNWCSIRAWTPGSTPPPTPSMSTYDMSPSPPASRGGAKSGGGGGGGLFRRFSKNRGPSHKPDVPRPPITGSGSGGLFRSFSRRNSHDSTKPPTQKLQRSPSTSKSNFSPARLLGLERPPRPERPDRPDDGGMSVNGQWDEESPGPDPGPTYGYGYDDDVDYYDPRSSGRDNRTSRLRGGASPEYEMGDESYFTARPPRRAYTTPDERRPHAPPHGPDRDRDRDRAPDPDSDPFEPKPFHRTPTGLSLKQMKRAEAFEVNLEGGLDISLNVEVNAKDPAGITVPYRLLVPRLFYDEEEDERSRPPVARQPSGFKRLLSFRGKKPMPRMDPEGDGPGREEEEQMTPEGTPIGMGQGQGHPGQRHGYAHGLSQPPWHGQPSGHSQEAAAPGPNIAMRREPITPTRDEDLYYDEDDDYFQPRDVRDHAMDQRRML